MPPYPIFDPVAKTGAVSGDDEVFVCTSSGANGRGLYTEEGFVVLKGSVGRLENAVSVQGTYIEKFRSRLLDSGIIKAQGKNIVFQRNELFRSPSMAGQALLGRTCNGWIDWKSQDGRTLDEVKRQSSDQGNE